MSLSAGSGRVVRASIAVATARDSSFTKYTNRLRFVAEEFPQAAPLSIVTALLQNSGLANANSPDARMNFHEYQAKQLFADYGIPVPPGKVATTPEQAAEAAKALGGDEWVVKAQIHAGGRGKAGGVKLVKSPDEAKAAAAKMLGTKMQTYQSGGRALPVNSVLITEATDIAKELYLSVLVDRGTKSVAFIASARGGVDIEQVARENPEDIHTIEVDFVEGLQPYRCRQLAFDMKLNAKQANQLTKIMTGL